MSAVGKLIAISKKNWGVTLSDVADGLMVSARNCTMV